MDSTELAKMIAGTAISQYDSEYFATIDATYLCTLENLVHQTIKAGPSVGESRIVLEFNVNSIFTTSDDSRCNRPGADTKIIFNLKSWNLKKFKTHLKNLLNTTADKLEGESGAKLISEALEPRAENDGKSVLSGTRCVVRVGLENDQKRIDEGKGPYKVFTITRLDQADEVMQGAWAEGEKVPF